MPLVGRISWDWAAAAWFGAAAAVAAFAVQVFMFLPHSALPPEYLVFPVIWAAVLGALRGGGIAEAGGAGRAWYPAVAGGTISIVSLVIGSVLTGLWQAIVALVIPRGGPNGPLDYLLMGGVASLFSILLVGPAVLPFGLFAGWS